jgi:N-acetylglucosamine-6-phosphate deacetylase
VTQVLATSSLCLPSEPAPGWVAIDGAVIVEVGEGGAPRGAVDLGDAVLAPGLVDLQCNGVTDVDFRGASPADWRRARRALVRRGVTAFCPTFVSAPLDAYDSMVRAAAQAQRAHDEPASAGILGVHLEGPFLGEAHGAHAREHVRSVDLGWLESILATYPELVRIVTLAPEADPELRATRMLSSSGVRVALGHSTAEYEQILRAVDAGASAVTHLFNGMASFHHRSPGLVGAALTEARLTPTIIADLVHVHPVALRIAFACKPATAVVSDAVGNSAAMESRDGAAWLPDGTLAGATTQLDGAVANLVRIGIPWSRAVAAATTAPAEIVGASEHGRLAAGARADLVAFDPHRLEVAGVWIAGVRAVVD